MKYNIWNKWDPLKVCMLGNNYAPEFFNGIPDKAGDPLKRICEETLEDLEGYKSILQDFGVEVIQPDMDRSERFVDNPHRYPRGPLQPRDHQLVLGNKCYSLNTDHPSIFKKLNDYSGISKIEFKYPYYENEEAYNRIAGADFPSYDDFLKNNKSKGFFKDFIWNELLECSTLPYLSGANMIMIGTKLFIGSMYPVDPSIKDIKDFENFEIVWCDMDGHTDGNFHPIKPGAILSLFDVQNYSQTFPGWDVCYLEDQCWSKVKKWWQMKQKNQGKWWLAGEEENEEFTHFVETWLQNWVGFVEETVFDVNVLVLDEHHVCVSQPDNEIVNTFLKKHKMEPVYVPWRHRFFWDGGLHCITLDLYREGVQKDYFLNDKS